MINVDIVSMKTLDDFIPNTVETLTQVVSETIKEVHGTAVAQAGVDTGRMRNTIRWSLNGQKYGGENSEPITTPSTVYPHKAKARALGVRADEASAADRVQFPRNRSKYTVIGYVSSSAKTTKRGFPYALYQEFGTMRMPAQPYMFYRLDTYAHTKTLTPLMEKRLGEVKATQYVDVPLGHKKRVKS